MTIEKKFETTDLENGKKLEWFYTGKNDMYLEGKVNSVEGDKLNIVLCGPWKEDITKSVYVPETKTFEVGVKRYVGTRIAILKGTSYTVPSEIEKVHVYEWSSNLKNMPKIVSSKKDKTKNNVGFSMTVKKNVSLEDAVNALLGVNSDINVVTKYRNLNMVYCKAPASTYENVFQTKLGEKTCSYTDSPSMLPARHTYITNLSKPILSEELQKYFSEVGSVGNHVHYCLRGK